MSEENIKTGLRLSEAIRLVEENEGALIKPEGIGSFYQCSTWSLNIDYTWAVKLPPVKSVNVTVAKLHEVLEPLKYNLYTLKDFEKFCKDLGL